MKKVFAVMMLVAATLGLAACGPSDNTEDPAKFHKGA